VRDSSSGAGVRPSGVLNMEPKLVAFAITFGLVATFWISHVSISRRLRAFDWATAWINLLFLFTIALTPFVATLLGEYGVFGNAWRFYCLTLMVVGAALILLVLVVYRDKGRLIGGIHRKEYWYRVTRAASTSVGFAISLALSLMGFKHISVILGWVMIPTILILARFLFPRGRA
jgi:uncharacterized membrane protein